jgi:hypothetical protein
MYPETDRLMNPATYGCRKDEGEYAAERLLQRIAITLTRMHATGTRLFGTMPRYGSGA